MNVMTYLSFTVLSIFIQFCVMDFIQEKLQTGDDIVHLNVTQKESLREILRNISYKPHALYYQTQTKRSLKISSPIISNTTALVTLGTTEATTTLFDVLYDDNSSDSEVTSTTEVFFTSTDYDNITEITFFENKNKSSNIPPLSAKPKTRFTNHCECDVLYKACDINCCCDHDCSDYEHNIFQCSYTAKANHNEPENDGCVSHLFDERKYGSTALDNLLCIVKTNLPVKRNIRKFDQVSVDQYYKWRSYDQKYTSYEFIKTLYNYADPVWLLKNETIYYLDFPTSSVNNYCTDRKPIEFLKQSKSRCNVKLKDLEMFNILKTCEEAMVISATDKTVNSSLLDCSNLHCINWTILVCENGSCKNYNKSMDEVSCTETTCTNVALKIDYEFYYFNLKIVNATIKLYVQNITSSLPLMSQEININFYISNKSIDLVLQLSGNPGYISGLPVIVSYAKSNHTEFFYNNTLAYKSNMVFPDNKNGLCEMTNTSNNIVIFGQNKRTKCLHVHPYEGVPKSDICKNIQSDINKLLKLNENVSISPYGNPRDLSDNLWLSLEIDTEKQDPVYGQFNEKSLKLHCYNLITRLSVIFMYASVEEHSFTAYTGQNKILSVEYEVTANNFSFFIEDLSVVITIDISFMDMTKPSVFEYAGSPHLNIYLPRDFFFPFPPNTSAHISTPCLMILLCSVIVFFCK